MYIENILSYMYKITRSHACPKNHHLFRWFSSQWNHLYNKCTILYWYEILWPGASLRYLTRNPGVLHVLLLFCSSNIIGEKWYREYNVKDIYGTNHWHSIRNSEVDAIETKTFWRFYMNSTKKSWLLVFGPQLYISHITNKHILMHILLYCSAWKVQIPYSKFIFSV